MPRRAEQPEVFAAAPRYADRFLGQWKRSKEGGEQHGGRGTAVGGASFLASLPGWSVFSETRGGTVLEEKTVLGRICYPCVGKPASLSAGSFLKLQ